MKTKINSFKELIAYFKRPEVEFSDIQQITSDALKAYFVDQHPKEEAIQLLIDFWAKWEHTKEKPLFIERH
jgi:predicted protein tyrosine phosphatase